MSGDGLKEVGIGKACEALPHDISVLVLFADVIWNWRRLPDQLANEFDRGRVGLWTVVWFPS
jgi:hypothetical protein